MPQTPQEKQAENVYKKKLAKINQPILITELLLHHDDSFKFASYGESKTTETVYKDHPTLIRLIDHIEIIAKLANQFHEDKNYQIKENAAEKKSTIEIKPASKNSITRISLSEFSLYTKDHPFTLFEFKALVLNIERIAKSCHSNLHILLSSICVKDDENNLFNYAFYIECGRKPNIRTFAKKTPSPDDIQYKGLTNIDAPESEGLVPAIIVPHENTSQAPTSYESVFIVKTAGEAEFLVGVDICFDHKKSHAKKALKDLIKRTNESKQFFLPEQITHIVSSNSFSLDYENIMGTLVTHADREYRSVRTDHTLKPIELKTTPEVQLAYSRHNIKTYDKTEMKVEAGGIAVKSPPFGGDFHIYVYPESDLSKAGHDPYGIAATRKEQIREINTSVVSYKIKTLFSHPVHSEEDTNRPLSPIIEEENDRPLSPDISDSSTIKKAA